MHQKYMFRRTLCVLLLIWGISQGSYEVIKPSSWVALCRLGVSRKVLTQMERKGERITTPRVLQTL